MFKRTVIATSVALAITALPAVAQEEEGSFLDEWEISGELKNETAVFTRDGTTIGAASAHDNGDLMKSESSARIFINGPVGENLELHAELRPVRDTEAVSGSKGHESYTQRDFMRELYVDTTAGEEDQVSLRIGKQQVVWGTADGMKLLDAINPTDYSEMAQNSMEDSRIPVWMINAETDLEDGSNVQFIASQAKSNFIPGLSTISNNSLRSTTATRSGSTGMATAMVHNIAAVDQGQPFIMKGVDSISGASNGILNIVPELAEVAATFGRLSAGFAYNSGGAAQPSYHLNNWVHANVNDFVTNSGNGAAFGGACPNIGVGADATTPSSAYCLQQIAANTNEGQTNLLSAMDSSAVGFTGDYSSGESIVNAQGTGGGSNVTGTWDASTPDTTFEYMPDATFKTFATFNLAKTKYVREGIGNANAAIRFKNTTDDGVNYSVNYMSGYDPNPYIELEWQNASGTKLTPVLTKDGTTGYVSVGLTDTGTTEAASSLTYGYVGSTTDHSFTITNPVTLALKEKHAKIHNFGASFDAAVETEQVGSVVLRGEFLYQKNVKTPVIDKAQMSIGNITEAFTAHEGDKFKYVLGADITALTNMMISAQFIQERNLDFVDTTSTVVATDGSVSTVTGNKYTADMPTMAMDNQYQKAEENKEFYSLFLSKPFGAEQQHRWNNIFMFEENGGKWNRFDVEYSFDDELIGTAELNKYWGDANTQFGQMEKSSNFQLGLKYLF